MLPSLLNTEKLLCIPPVLVLIGEARIAKTEHLPLSLILSYPVAKEHCRILIHNLHTTFGVAVNWYNKFGVTKNATYCCFNTEQGVFVFR